MLRGLAIPLFDDARGRRIAQLLAVLWLLSIADLIFTLWAHFFTTFFELNPIARAMLDEGLILSLVLFKLVVTAIGTLILWRLRRHRAAEAGAWLMAGVYVMLTLHWSSYTVAATNGALVG